MSALLEMGTTTKVLASSKWKNMHHKFKHTETTSQKHLKHMHRMELARNYGHFSGSYEGIKTCFVCDIEITDANIKTGECPLCATVLNHTTIRIARKKAPLKEVMRSTS